MLAANNETVVKATSVINENAALCRSREVCMYAPDVYIRVHWRATTLKIRFAMAGEEEEVNWKSNVYNANNHNKYERRRQHQPMKTIIKSSA